MSAGLHGYGTALVVGTGSNTTVIGNIISLAGPNEAREVIDYSTMDSTSKFREKLDGMLDAGEGTIELNYDGSASGIADKLNTLKTSSANTWTITFNDGGTATDSSWACVGFMTGLGYAIPFEDKVTSTLSLAFTGIPTYTDLAA